jgi:hypothetical protein
MGGDNISRTKEILSQAKDIPSVGINGGMQSCLVCEPAPTLAHRKNECCLILNFERNL